MQQFYTTYKFSFTLLLATLFTFCGYSQEIKILTTKDFQLRGAVKSCITKKDYGTEEFYFTPNGRLKKSVTQFNETDYDITQYEYNNGSLVKKTVQSFREGELDKQVSFIHIYKTLISDEKKVSEHIFNYLQEPLEQYDYYYNENDMLIKTVHHNDEGIEETLISYEYQNGTVFKETHTVEGQIRKEIKRLVPRMDYLIGEYEELTINYNNAQPINATLKFVRRDGNLGFFENLSIGKKNYNKYFSVDKVVYTYNEQGFVATESIYKKQKLIETKKFSYIFEEDKPIEEVNWLTQIQNKKLVIERTLNYYH
jgi:hypothetical protein